MSSSKREAPTASITNMKTSDLSNSDFLPAGEDDTNGNGRLFLGFDEFLDRMPAWIFHTLGGLTALIALWFALAFLGGLPGSAVEWIALAMFGAFAYAVSFMLTVVVTYLYEMGNRILMAVLVLGGSAAVGAMAVPPPL
jgi:hypothetical protein